MKNKILIVLGVLCLGSSANAGNWNAGARVSTLGLGAEVGYLFNDTFGLRLQGTWWEHFKKTLSYDGVKYHNVRFRPVTFTLYADWYFYTNWWRVSLGGGYNATKIRLNQDLTNDPNYGFMGVVSAKYRYKNPVSYYAGTGIDIRHIAGSNWTFTMDAGIYFMSPVSARVTSTGPGAASPVAMQKLKRESEELLNNKKLLRTYPAVSLGFKYEF